MASILPNTDSLHLGHSYTARICLISGGSSAPPIQPLPLPALSLSGGPISSSRASSNSLQICCSGGHDTTPAAPAAMHDYCCSVGHCTTTTSPAPIVQQLLRWLSHLRALFHRYLIVLLILHSAPWMLQPRLPDRDWEGVIHFCGELNLSSHLQKFDNFL